MTLKPFQILRPSIRLHRVDLVVAVLAAIGAQTIAIPMPLLTRWVIHEIRDVPVHGPDSVADASERLLWQFAAMVTGLALLRGVLRWQQGMRGERMAQGVLADVRGRMYRHLQALSQGYFDRRPTAKILIRFVGDANALRAWLARTVVTVPADVLTLVGIAVALTTIMPELLPAAVFPLLAMVPALVWINPRARRWTRDGRRSQTRLCGVLDHRVSAVGVIKSVGAQEPVAAEVQQMIDRVATANVRRARLDAWAQSLSASAALASLGAVGFWGIRCYLNETLGQGDLMAAVWLTLLLRSPVTRLCGANVVHQRARVAVERIGALLEREPERGWSPTLAPYTGPGRTIQLRRLSYRDAARNWVIRDLTATIEGPGLVCVTDESGRAGGTLFELLLRLRRPHKGRFFLDGQDARKLRVADLRRRIGWVDRGRHGVDLVAMSLHRNGKTVDDPRFAAAWVSTQTIVPTAPVADAGALLDRWNPNDKRDHLARDVRLRLAVTCALLGDPPILLLDDPTAELTEASALRFVEWLREISPTRLVVVATNDPRIVQIAAQTIHLLHTARKSASGNGARSRRTRSPFREVLPSN
jgi:ABC-type multidrug transport system fused ATPase/permease subunit